MHKIKHLVPDLNGMFIPENMIVKMPYHESGTIIENANTEPYYRDGMLTVHSNRIHIQYVEQRDVQKFYMEESMTKENFIKRAKVLEKDDDITCRKKNIEAILHDIL